MTHELKIVKSKGDSVIHDTKRSSTQHIAIEGQTLIELIGRDRYMDQETRRYRWMKIGRHADIKDVSKVSERKRRRKA